MAKKSKAYTKDLNSDVIMRNEQFAEKRSAKLAEAKTTRDEEQSKKQKEALALSKTSANLVSQGRYTAIQARTLARQVFTIDKHVFFALYQQPLNRHKGTDYISRNEAHEAARLERLAAAEYAKQKPTGGSRATNDARPGSNLEPVVVERWVTIYPVVFAFC